MIRDLLTHQHCIAFLRLSKTCYSQRLVTLCQELEEAEVGCDNTKCQVQGLANI